MMAIWSSRLVHQKVGASGSSQVLARLQSAEQRMDELHGLGVGDHLIGDEGSAYSVVLDALRLVARRADGRDAQLEDMIH